MPIRPENRGRYPTDWPMHRIVLRAIADPGHFTPRGDNYDEPLVMWQRRAVLHALASWADGHLLDPDGWRRVKADTRGVDYCTRHHGIRNEDAHGCDFQEECPKCGGFPDGIRECRRCGDSGADPCVLTPLYTLKDS